MTTQSQSPAAVKFNTFYEKAFLILFPISVLRSLDTKAYKLYDRTNRFYDADLLKRCYKQHALRTAIEF